MLKNVTEKKIPQNPTKIVILKKNIQKFPKVSRTEKKSVVDNYSIHSNCFCVCFLSLLI